MVDPKSWYVLQSILALQHAWCCTQADKNSSSSYVVSLLPHNLPEESQPGSPVVLAGVHLCKYALPQSVV